MHLLLNLFTAILTLPMNNYDLIVIGGGSGGLATARRAASYQAKVLLIESHDLGGTCVNLGCIPKKMTYNLTMLKEYLKIAKDYGIKNKSKLNYEKFVNSRNEYILKLRRIYNKNLKKENVEVINGYAEVTKDGVIVGDTTYKYKYLVLATGSKAKQIEVKYGAEYFKISDDFFALTQIPKRAVLVGSGYISIEIGFMLAELGCKVTLIARGSKLLSHFDSVIGETVLKNFMDRGVDVLFNTKVVGASKDSVEILQNNETKNLKADFIMSAIGRDCDLSYIKLPIDSKNSYITVNNNFETNVPNVFAIGDLLGTPFMLTPFAIYCGRLLANHLFKTPCNDIKNTHRITEFVPSVIFSHPPAASVGKQESNTSKVYKTSFTNLFYSVSSHKQKTVIKVVTENDLIVGLHMVGDNVDEIVQGFAVAMKKGITIHELWDCVGVHPTAAEEIVTIK